MITFNGPRLLERSESEWRSLLASTGFAVGRASAELVEAVPA
jgi:hypothetical protein